MKWLFFFLQMPRCSGSAWERIHILDLDIRKGIHKLDLQVREGIHELPFSTAVRKTPDFLDLEVWERPDNLDFDIREGIDNLDLAIEPFAFVTA